MSSSALDQAEADLQAKLAKAAAKEKEDLQQQLDAIRQRRETMLSQLVQLRDMARDGRKLMLPLVNRVIPLVADPWAKPELGSGCVKITPGYYCAVFVFFKLPEVISEDGFSALGF